MVFVSKVATRKCADHRAHAGESDVGQQDLQQAVEDRFICDVVGIEAELNEKSSQF